MCCLAGEERGTGIRPRFKPGTSRIRSKRVDHYATSFFVEKSVLRVHVVPLVAKIMAAETVES
jgi:hypothetical protein